MAIVNTDIVYRYSVAAAAGNTTASSAAASLGDQVATNGPTTAVANDVFDDVSGAEASAGATDYRCLFALNNHATLSLLGAKVSISSQTSGGATVTIGLDPAGITPKGQASAQAATIANEAAAPAGVSFSAGPLTIGDIPAGSVAAFWIKRVTPPGATVQADGAVFSVDGDTLP
jgi:hypothetical protein